ncbi:MAG: hypothetical protein RLZZ453_824 [Chlamydiota bacterium]|jgi:hypothetical protein
MQNWRVFLDLIKKSPTLHKYTDLLETNLRLLRCQKKELLVQELHTLEKPFHVLIEKAARIRLAALHAEVMQIRSAIDLEDWKRVCVVVMGPPMPREGELSMQYFGKILATTAFPTKCPYARALTSTVHLNGKQRLIYAESIYEEDKALDLITTHICDEEIGRVLLNDESSMRADILKQAAKGCLETMFPA